MPALYLATGHVAGEQISSTYEGRMLTLEESYLTHPVHGDGLVDAGDPVNCGVIVGVAMNSAAAATDLIAIDTEGIWFLSVFGNDGGASAVIPGDELYITTGVVSKIGSGVPFGEALGNVNAGATAVCAVKVHNSPVLGGSTRVGHQFEVSYDSFLAADITAGKGFFIAPAACKVVSGYHAHRVVAGQAGTLQVEKCNTGEAPAAGDEVMASAWDLTSVVDTPVAKAALATGVEVLVAGDQLRLKLASGAATSLVDGVVTLLMEWT